MDGQEWGKWEKKRRIFTTQKYHLLIMQCCILHIAWAIFQTALRACVAELFHKVFHVILISEVSQSNTAANGAIRWWLWLNSVTVEHFSFFSSKGIMYIILISSWLSLKNQSYTLPLFLCVIVSIDGASRKNWKRPVPSLNRGVFRKVPIMQSSYSQCTWYLACSTTGKMHILQTRALFKDKFAWPLLEKEHGALGGKVCELLTLLGQRL